MLGRRLRQPRRFWLLPSDDAASAMHAVNTAACTTNHTPTMTGGVDYKSLHPLLREPLYQQQSAPILRGCRSLALWARRSGASCTTSTFTGDQASVLVQVELLDVAGLPVAGVETGRQLLDETLPSNTLMGLREG